MLLLVFLFRRFVLCEFVDLAFLKAVSKKLRSDLVSTRENMSKCVFVSEIGGGLMF